MVVFRHVFDKVNRLGCKFIFESAPKFFTTSYGLRLAPVAFKDDSNRVLNIDWDSGHTSSHPYVWLKDACRCTKCTSPISLTRQTLLSSLDLKCNPEVINFREEEQKLEITWNDSHQSVYPYGWLSARCFSPEAQVRQSEENFGPKKKPWNERHCLGKFDWSDLMNNEKIMLDFLIEVHLYGTAVVTGAPKDKSGLDDLINTIAYPYTCHYGMYFDVQNKPDPTNVSYTPGALNMHTDLPCFNVLLGVQFLHCMTKTHDIVGGENFVADGFYVAEEIRKTDPSAFQMLTETDVQFWDYGTDFLKDFHLVSKHKIIRLDKKGNCSRIAFSNHLRDTYPFLPANKVEEFFRALKLFDSKLMEHSITHQLEEGEIAIFDNYRVTHGRAAYRMLSETAERHLRGTYIAWDEFHSRLRRLRWKYEGLERRALGLA